MSDPRVQELFAAIFEENAKRVASLFAAGVSPDARDEEGTTPLYWASIHGGSWMIGLLLTAGADPNELSGGECEDSPLCGAACFGLRHAARTLVNGGANPNQPELFGMTPLIWAVSGAWFETAADLLTAGADPDQADDDGRTPLHHAALRGWLPGVRLLLERGAHPDVVDVEGQTPLALVERWAGKDVETTLRDEFAEQAPAGTTIEARRILILEARYPNGGGMGREMECSHAEIAQLLRSSE
jgi:ankyrin repeat protein